MFPPTGGYKNAGKAPREAWPGKFASKRIKIIIFTAVSGKNALNPTVDIV
jgi:hypothetical protein